MDAASASSLQVQPCRVVREGLVAADANSRPAVWRVGRVSREGLSAASDTAAGSRLLGKKERRKDGEEAAAIASTSERGQPAIDKERNFLLGTPTLATPSQRYLDFLLRTLERPKHQTTWWAICQD